MDAFAARAGGIATRERNQPEADMATRQDEIRELMAREPAPAHRLAQLRSAGMHAIRFEFVVRLLRAELRMDTLSIFWDHGVESLRERPAGEGGWRLVLGRGNRVTAEFPDLWVLCYPGDAEIKRQVEAEIDGLVHRVRAQFADSRRPREFFPPRSDDTSSTRPPQK
jgi:hypothetical protein